MKIYNYIKIDMTTGKTLEEDSFEYDGPMALCWEGEEGGYGQGGGYGGGYGGEAPEGGGGIGGSDWDSISNKISALFSGLSDPANRATSPEDYAKAEALNRDSTAGIAGKFGLSWEAQQHISAALAVVTTAFSPMMGISAAMSLAKKNYADRMDNLTGRGITPDVAANRIAAENREWGANIDRNVTDPGGDAGGFGEILKSLPGNTEWSTVDEDGTMTPQEKATKEAEAYFKATPGAEEAFAAAKARNSKWTREEWAKANFNERKAAGQDVTWPEVGEDGTVKTGEEPPAGPAEGTGSISDMWNTYNPGAGQNPFGTSPMAGNALQPGGPTEAPNTGASVWGDLTEQYNKWRGPTEAPNTGGVPPGYSGPNAMQDNKWRGPGSGYDYTTDPDNVLSRTVNQAPGQGNALAPGYSGGVMQPSTDIYNRSMGDVNRTMTQGRADIDAGVNEMMTQFTEAENKAEAALKQALATGRGDINTALAQVTEEMRPYDIAGKKALENVMGMIQSGVPSMEEFRKSRTYQSPLEDMSQNMQRLAAVKGQFLDPATINAINQKAQDYGSQRWNEFQENEYWRPMQANMNVAQNIGMPASGRIADASQWAGGTKAQMEQNTGNSLAQNAQWGGAGRAGAQQWGAGAKTDLGMWGSGQKTGIGQNYIQNMLNKGNQGIQWYNAGEGQKERDWTQNIGMPWAEQQSDKAMDMYARTSQKNQQNSIWNSVIGGVGNIFGSWLGG